MESVDGPVFVEQVQGSRTFRSKIEDLQRPATSASSLIGSPQLCPSGKRLAITTERLKYFGGATTDTPQTGAPMWFARLIPQLVTAFSSRLQPGS